MRPLVGISLKLCSVLIFIVMASMIKAAHVPPGEAVFFRSFFAIPVIVAWLALRGELATGFRTANPLGHVWRGLMGTTAMGMGFAGLAYLPLPEVTAIGYASPLMVVILASMFLGEQVRAFRIASVVLGLTGVLIVLSPRLSITNGGTVGQTEAFGAMIVLCGAMFAALAQVFVRKLIETETTATIVFYFSATSTVLSLITLPFGWVVPSPTETALLVGAGILGGAGQIFLTASYREADASLVAPFDYASMIFALLIGYFIFAEVPSLTMLFGAALIITAGILIIWREHRLGLRRARESRDVTPH